jgi:hypothetical protein
LLVLHLHQVAQGTCTPRTPDMPGTHGALFARRLRRSKTIDSLETSGRGTGPVLGEKFWRLRRGLDHEMRKRESCRRKSSEPPGCDNDDLGTAIPVGAPSTRSPLIRRRISWRMHFRDD